jgi:tyrosyl-tRNA synthetase
VRIPDQLMRAYFELLTDVPEEEIARLTDPAKCHPRDTKEHLAKIIITQYHSAEAAEAAADEFRRVHGGGSQGLPDDIPEVSLPADKMKDGKIVALDLVMACGFEKSRSEGRRIVAERGVRLNGLVIEDANEPLDVKTGDILQRGRRRFVRLVVP